MSQSSMKRPPAAAEDDAASAAPPAKRAKSSSGAPSASAPSATTRTGAQHVALRSGLFEPVRRAQENLRRVYDRTRWVDDQCIADQLVIQTAYDQLKKPLFEKRSLLLRQIPGFWGSVICRVLDPRWRGAKGVSMDRGIDFSLEGEGSGGSSAAVREHQQHGEDHLLFIGETGSHAEAPSLPIETTTEAVLRGSNSRSWLSIFWSALWGPPTSSEQDDIRHLREVGAERERPREGDDRLEGGASASPAATKTGAEEAVAGTSVARSGPSRRSAGAHLPLMLPLRASTSAPGVDEQQINQLRYLLDVHLADNLDAFGSHRFSFAFSQLFQDINPEQEGKATGGLVFQNFLSVTKYVNCATGSVTVEVREIQPAQTRKNDRKQHQAASFYGRTTSGDVEPATNASSDNLRGTSTTATASAESGVVAVEGGGSAAGARGHQAAGGGPSGNGSSGSGAGRAFTSSSSAPPAPPQKKGGGKKETLKERILENFEKLKLARVVARRGSDHKTGSRKNVEAATSQRRGAKNPSRLLLSPRSAAVTAANAKANAPASSKSKQEEVEVGPAEPEARAGPEEIGSASDHRERHQEPVEPGSASGGGADLDLLFFGWLFSEDYRKEEVSFGSVFRRAVWQNPFPFVQDIYKQVRETSPSD